MAIKVTKPSVNLREKLNELETNKGIKGNEILQAETAQEVRTLIGAGRKNLIINGDFRVSQRGDFEAGTTVPVTDSFYFDRFSPYVATMTGTFQIVPATINGGSYKSLRMTATNTAGGELLFQQNVEAQNLTVGEEYTISAWVKSNTTSVTLRSYDGANYSVGVGHSGGGGWEKLTKSFTALTSASGRYVLQMFNNAQTTGDVWEFALPQLELGSVATDFEHRSYGEELALCQRYYEKITLAICPTLDVGNPNRNYIPAHSVWMRAPPTVTLSSPATGNSNETYEFSSGQALTITSVSTGVAHPAVSAYFQLSTSANRAQYVTATFSAEL